MDKKINSLVMELRQELKKAYKDFRGLYIYGSQVSGKAREFSDVDAIILFDDYDLEKLDALWGIVSFLDYKYDTAIDAQPMTKQELERNYIFKNEVVGKGVFYDAQV